MKQLMRSTDIVTILHVRSLLDGQGIATFELDVNMSVLEGSIGIFPRRLMVADDEYEDAVEILTDAGFGAELDQ